MGLGMEEYEFSNQKILDVHSKMAFEASTILLVDDQPLNLQMLNETLSQFYSIKIAKSGVVALKLAREFRPDLILLDVVMPDMDGYEVCRELKRSEGTRDIPVIFLTGASSEEHEVKGLSLGAVDYIAKPFNFPIVKARIQTHLKLKKQNDLLARLATVDSLTHIPNRRCADNVLRHEWRRAQRTGNDISIGMADVDYFKLFNDHYGHAEGDRCLQQVAEVLSKSTKRPGDFIGRFGGEEFIFILPGTPLKGAMYISELFRESVLDLKIQHEKSPIQPYVTLSIGVICSSPSPADSLNLVLEQADKQLYDAKNNGRNQTFSTEFQSSEMLVKCAVK